MIRMLSSMQAFTAGGYDFVTKTGKAKGTITIPSAASGGTDTSVDAELDVNLTDDGQAVITVTYIINDNVLTTYVPIETMHSGRHILNLYYPLSGLEANAYNTFRVRMRIPGTLLLLSFDSLTWVSVP